MQIQISWLLQKATDLDLHCLLRQGMSCSAREGLIPRTHHVAEIWCAAGQNSYKVKKNDTNLIWKIYNEVNSLKVNIELLFLFSAHQFGHVKPKRAFEHARKWAFRSCCACAKCHPSLCSPVIQSVVSNDSVGGQWRPWSDCYLHITDDCADAQADLGIRCPHMTKDKFSHVSQLIML